MLETIQSAENTIVALIEAPVTEQEAALQQAQSEAIVDLLLLGMHADRHVSALESDLLETEIANLSWDQFYSTDIYLQRITPLIREAIGNSERQNKLLQSISDRITDADVKKMAIEQFSTMLEIDGQNSVEASLFDQAIAILLGGELAATV
jgi:hypothetical protein